MNILDFFKVEAYERMRFIKEAAPAYGEEMAKQKALSKSYDVEGAAIRLECCSKTVLNLIKDGRIRYTPVGKKGYRISEQACREFMGDIPVSNIERLP